MPNQPEQLQTPVESVTPRRRVTLRLLLAGLAAGTAGAVLFSALPGCYLARLGAGQFRVASGQRSVEEVLVDPATPESHRDALRLIGEIRRFGVETLGMTTGDSYTSYFDTKGRPVMYNVTASRADRLEPVTWWFPVVGSVAYKGFFSFEDAKRERDYLERLGYDALASPVSAYSTLGWFRDPVLSTMLDDPPEVLAELVLHEMTHATVFAAGDTDFNELLASFMGGAATESFFNAREGADGPTLRRHRARQADRRRFGAWIRETRTALVDFYAGPGTAEEKRAGRQAVFAAARERFKERSSGFETDSYRGFERVRLNNAILLSLGRYNDTEKLFAGAAAKAGGNLRRLMELAKAWALEDRPQEAARRWAEAATEASAKP
jgi:predicted aminopeptidase